MPEEMEALLRQVQRDLRIATTLLVVAITLLVGTLALAAVTTPGANLGCTRNPPPGWSHYPVQVQKALEQYCGS